MPLGPRGPARPRPAAPFARRAPLPLRLREPLAALRAARTCPTAATRPARTRSPTSSPRSSTAAGGRTLALFTSRRALERRGRGGARDGRRRPCCSRASASRATLLEAFASDEATSLFATMGFWQGVDVPGRTLSLLAIDRLPFGRPDDPMLQARRERARTPRSTPSTCRAPRCCSPRASGGSSAPREDRGVVCVLDTRLATASTAGRCFTGCRRCGARRGATTRSRSCATATAPR